MRYFIFEWGSTRSESRRHNKITLSKPSGDIGHDAKAALNIFCSQFGGLHKVDIYSIQEVDKEGNPIGEVIKPTGESSVVPVSKDIKTK